MSTHEQDPANREDLKSENDFLKMKLMLERGAQFGGAGENEGIPPEIENQFLRNIIEFEEQFESQKKIKVFDKIERPTQFKPVDEIVEWDIDDAWEKLERYLSKYSIQLSASGPNVSTKELYRFVVEELFEFEMDDINIPGMCHGFIYDEFHPDHEFENTRAAVDDCIREILCKKPMEWMFHFRKSGIRLNEIFPLTEEEFKSKVNGFKEAYTGIEVIEITDHQCSINEKQCNVKGNYKIIGILPGEEIKLEGYWLVEFELNDWDYWYISNVQIPGIHF